MHNHIVRLLGCYVGQDGDNALAAQRQNRQNLIVIAAVNIEIGTNQSRNFSHLRQIAACFLHCNDVLYLCQLRNCLGCNVATGSAGYIVKNDGNIDAVCNCCVVQNQPLLCCLVVVGGYQQNGISACLFAALCQFDTVCGIIAACTRDNGNTTCRSLFCEADTFNLYLIGHGRCLPCCAADDQRVCIICNLKFNQFLHFIKVYAAVSVHGCYEGYACSCENRHMYDLLTKIELSYIV